MVTKSSTCCEPLQLPHCDTGRRKSCVPDATQSCSALRNESSTPLCTLRFSPTETTGRFVLMPPHSGGTRLLNVFAFAELGDKLVRHAFWLPVGASVI